MLKTVKHHVAAAKYCKGGEEFADCRSHYGGGSIDGETLKQNDLEKNGLLNEREMADSQNMRQYIALTPDFVRQNICFWIGDVEDAILESANLKKRSTSQ